MGFRPRHSEGTITVDEAQQRVLSAIKPLPAGHVPLADALGCILREAVSAPFDVPERDNSAMDGYAIVAGDAADASEEAPARLRVVEDLPAGAIATGVVTRGKAARIMTGALIPPGADAVVQVEWTDAGEDLVSIYRRVEPGANIRPRGEDIRQGETVLAPGLLLTAGEIGVLASVQKREVLVSKRAVVSIISTGDELVSIDQPRLPGKVVNSNAWALAAMVREAGAVPRVHELVRDDRDATLATFRAALESDFVISTGGVSAGAYDYVHDVLATLGAETRFSEVAMKPGKPVVFSMVGDRPLFALPGNPVSCLVGFLLFVLPALRAASGRSGDPRLPVVAVRMSEPIRSKGDRQTFIRVRVEAGEGGLVATPTGAQGSAITTSMVGANGLAWLETGVSRIGAGEFAPALLYGLPQRAVSR